MAYARRLTLMLTMVAVLAAALSVASANVDRKLLQAQAASGDQCGPPNAVYVGDEDDSCQRCAQRPNTVAWCCRSDETASPTECKRAGANCCEGPEYRYVERERDDDNDNGNDDNGNDDDDNGNDDDNDDDDDGGIETDDGELDDVWCVPNTCQDNLQPPQATTATAAAAAAGGAQQASAPSSNQCGPPNAVYIGDDDDSCQACAQRPNTLAWCCRSDDTASPTECKRAGANCCEGPEYRYLERELDDDNDDDNDGDNDDDDGVDTDDGELDDVWCVPNTCQDNFQPPQATTATAASPANALQTNPAGGSPPQATAAATPGIQQTTAAGGSPQANAAVGSQTNTAGTSQTAAATRQSSAAGGLVVLTIMQSALVASAAICLLL